MPVENPCFFKIPMNDVAEAFLVLVSALDIIPYIDVIVTVA